MVRLRALLRVLYLKEIGVDEDTILRNFTGTSSVAQHLIQLNFPDAAMLSVATQPTEPSSVGPTDVVKRKTAPKTKAAGRRRRAAKKTEGLAAAESAPTKSSGNGPRLAAGNKAKARATRTLKAKDVSTRSKNTTAVKKETKNVPRRRTGKE